MDAKEKKRLDEWIALFPEGMREKVRAAMYSVLSDSAAIKNKESRDQSHE